MTEPTIGTPPELDTDREYYVAMVLAHGSGGWELRLAGEEAPWLYSTDPNTADAWDNGAEEWVTPTFDERTAVDDYVSTVAARGTYDAYALDQLAELLRAPEWNGGTVEAAAEVVRRRRNLTNLNRYDVDGNDRAEAGMRDVLDYGQDWNTR